VSARPGSPYAQPPISDALCATAFGSSTIAGLEDPHLVAKAVITSLGIADKSGQWPTSLLVAHLASREALLILDNCEHLLDAIAVLAATAPSAVTPFGDAGQGGEPSDRQLGRDGRLTVG
jgi:hypothetical protein